MLAYNIVSASYPALHALHFGDHNAVLDIQHHAPSLEQISDSLALNQDLGLTTTSLEDYDAHPHYNFAYDISDSLTGDVKQQEEERDGDMVHGQVRHISRRKC